MAQRERSSVYTLSLMHATSKKPLQYKEGKCISESIYSTQTNIPFSYDIKRARYIDKCTSCPFNLNAASPHINEPIFTASPARNSQQETLLNLMCCSVM